MKKLILLTVFAGMLPIAMQAQDDDLYFTPKKSADKTSTQQSASQRSETPYYSGSSRDVDEYNRRPMHSYYETIGTDSLGNDIIEFHSGAEDSTKVFKAPDYDDESDYAYSRRMSRFDDFYWYDPWFDGYYGFYGYSPYRFYRWYPGWYGYSSWYSWYDPFWYDWYYPYGPYYNGWYSGWYGGWYGGPWYGGWYGRTHYRDYGGNYHGNNRSGGIAGRGTGSRRGGHNGYGTGRRTVSSSSGSNGSNGSRGGSYTPRRSSSSSTTNTGSFGGGGGGGHFGGRYNKEFHFSGKQIVEYLSCRHSSSG